jgi:methionyl-tRNA formyltransferase
VTPLRLALIHTGDHPHRYLESLLSRRFDLALVVVEPARAAGAAAHRRGRYRDWVSHRYHGCRRALSGRNRYRRRYFAHAPQLWAGPGPRRLRVPSVNDRAVQDALRAAGADVVVVVGCSRLAEATLGAAGPLVVSVHGGLLPHYRGRHGLFAAVSAGRPDLAGATLHRVDLGLATGDLIETVRPQARPAAPAEHLYCGAHLLAIHRLAGWLEILERGGELPSAPQPLLRRGHRPSSAGSNGDSSER